uniref:Glutaredoxin domain-containing protein n=1 Tax=Haptolina ericina TaxID=156174 RepID=A0A7S3ETY6_9EUKA|mmetsp:Transcript_23959/g.54489  ORF Transcript_23959/g.54489 Transcript_23959/m.54489 type:complete len:159 (+) Transcript_23959:17-493(+)
MMTNVVVLVSVLCLGSVDAFLRAVPAAPLISSTGRGGSARPGPIVQQAPDGLPPQVSEKIDKMVQDNKIMLFMKGNKLFPQCGFSNTAVAILNSLNVEFETCDVLTDEAVRSGIKTYSNWPTIPQCYIEGEFIGGCDIMIEMYQSGELAEMVERAAAS